MAREQRTKMEDYNQSLYAVGTGTGTGLCVHQIWWSANVLNKGQICKMKMKMVSE